MYEVIFYRNHQIVNRKSYLVNLFVTFGLMNSIRLRSLTTAFLLVIAISCNRDDDPSPFVVNSSVKPVDFLTEKTYTTLNIEVAYVEGYQPSATALNNLVTFLAARLNKSAGVTITQHTMPSSNKTTIDL